MRWGTSRTAGAAGVCALVAVLAAAPPAAGKGTRKIEVRPGPHAIADAVGRAEAGDVVRIHRGRYEETLEVDKRVRLVAASKRRPVIDGTCSTRSTLEAQADGVRLRRLKVVGGLAIEVDFTGVSGSRANQLVVKDTCDAEYGINVFDAGPTQIVDSRAFGFHDAGFYVGGVTSTPGGSIQLKRSEAFANLRGVIIENSAGGVIHVRRNELAANDVPAFGALPTGILITNSDGVIITRNQVLNNAQYGLDITPDSDGNVVSDNTFLDNPVDIRNQGTGNCGSGNASETGDTLPPC